MNWRALPLIALLLANGGCSMLVAQIGRDVEGLETRDEVRAKLGEPVSIEQVEDGIIAEEYVTRWRVVDESKSYGHGLAIVMTYGLAELFIFPDEVAKLIGSPFVSQKIRFVYNPAGEVVDGSHLSLLRRMRFQASIDEPPLELLDVQPRIVDRH